MNRRFIAITLAGGSPEISLLNSAEALSKYVQAAENGDIDFAMHYVADNGEIIQPKWERTPYSHFRETIKLVVDAAAVALFTIRTA